MKAISTSARTATTVYITPTTVMPTRCWVMSTAIRKPPPAPCSTSSITILSGISRTTGVSIRRLTLDLRHPVLPPDAAVRSQQHVFQFCAGECIPRLRRRASTFPGTSGGKRVAIDPGTGSSRSGRLYRPIRARTAAIPRDGLHILGQNGVSKDPYTTSPIAVAPRVGFAYDLTGDGKTALRGGFGIYYNRLDGNQVYNLSGQAPYSYTPQVNYTTFSAYLRPAAATWCSDLPRFTCGRRATFRGIGRRTPASTSSGSSPGTPSWMSVIPATGATTSSCLTTSIRFRSARALRSIQPTPTPPTAARLCPTSFCEPSTPGSTPSTAIATWGVRTTKP